MRKKLIAGNWKMNKTVEEAVELVKAIKVSEKVDILVCPPFTALDAVSKLKKVDVGAQNMYFEDSGAYTGEISPLMIKELCSYVIIGHSERRAYFGEDNSIINSKIKKALEHKLKVIVCVGEKLEEREAGKMEEVVEDHVKGALEGIDDLKEVVIAYEPVWAIGTGKTATPLEAEEAHKFIRSLISEMYSDKVASKIRVLYGGSVKPSNAKELLSKEDIDGALIGGASLKAEDFNSIIENG